MVLLKMIKMDGRSRIIKLFRRKKIATVAGLIYGIFTIAFDINFIEVIRKPNAGGLFNITVPLFGDAFFLYVYFIAGSIMLSMGFLSYIPYANRRSVELYTGKSLSNISFNEYIKTKKELIQKVREGFNDEV